MCKNNVCESFRMHEQCKGINENALRIDENYEELMH